MERVKKDCGDLRVCYSRSMYARLARFCRVTSCSALARGGVVLFLFLAVSIGAWGGLSASARAEEGETAAAGESRVALSALTVKTAKGDAHSFRVEIAETLVDLQRGLMFRKSMEADRGMIFLFSRPVAVEMWMKNTYIPLDVLFIREDGSIAGIHANAQPLDETPFTAPEPVAAALEINGGLAEKMGIAVGDRVVMPPFFP